MSTLLDLCCVYPHAVSNIGVRKNFFLEQFACAHLTGIGGPGAPHVFHLQRLDGSGYFLKVGSILFDLDVGFV